MRTHLVVLTLVCTAATGVPAGAAVPGSPMCDGEVATIVGTPGREVIVGTAGPDVIAGLGGRDVIRGLGGRDVICGGDGADRLYGGGGDDRLLAGRARFYSNRDGSYYVPDRLYGGPGDDTLDIGREPHHESLDGFSGEIRFPTATRGVVVDLAAGTATGEGTDVIVARAGLSLIGTPYADVLLGSDQAELLHGRGGPDRIDGRAGNDWLLGDEASREGAPGEGRPGADDDVMSGGRGNDYVWGDLGADDLSGGPGRDGLAANGLGVHQLTGGPGDDNLDVVVSAEPGVLLAGGRGDDELDVGLHAAVPAPRNMGIDLRDGSVTVGSSDIGTVVGLEGFLLTGGSAWTFHGTDGPDRLSSYPVLTAWLYGGHDVVWGSDDDDSIDAGDGKDVVHGRDGQDTCLGVERADGCEITS